VESPGPPQFRGGRFDPVVFGTAYHALHNLARLRRGETILIHAAAGGVGLAAVQLAQKIGAVVLATAGSKEKRDLLLSLGAVLVMDSRTLDFADEVLRYTDGLGVDVVLNSLSGAFQQRSLAICAPHGRFVEIGKRDLFENRALPLAAFQRSLSFFAFDLATVFASRGEDSQALKRFLSKGFNDGTLRPISCTAFAAADAISAFRLMQTAQHIGKIVLEFDPERAPEVQQEFWPNPDGTYLITGGLSGFGLATARWLVERGARHLALLSRRGTASAKDESVLDEMRGCGVTIHTFVADVANAKALGRVFRRLKNLAHSLRGVFHSAMVLRDRFLPGLTPEDLAAVLAPKAIGAWNLHEQTRDLPLDCFVMFSSISSLIGAPGQANYAAANAFLDALAHRRRAEGLPALTVNWGHLGDVGVAADQVEIGRYLEAMGVHAIPADEALATLPRLITSAEAQVGVMDVDWAKLGRANAKFRESPVFRDLAQSEKSAGPDGTGNWRETMLELPTEERAAAVTGLIISQVAATTGAAPADIDPASPLNGMDSLMAVELKVRIEEHTGCVLPVHGLNAEMTVTELAKRLLEQIRPTERDAKLATPSAPSAATGMTSEIAAPLLRLEPVPLLELVRLGKLEQLTAAALMPWPITLFEQSGVAPESLFQQLHGGRVSLDLILETPLGSVGIFMLPLTTAQVNPGEASLLPLAMEGIRHASTCGARCIALTGLIPSATNYGASIQSACEAEGNLAQATTGHATTVAAVLLNLVALLDAAERDLACETVMFYGIGSIGLGALQLMLDVLPHPAELRLCDPFRSEFYFSQLEATLRREHDFRGIIRVVTAAENRDVDFYDASVIIGATNVENVLDVARLAPGTLIVDDSSPHCLNGPAAFARLMQNHDILFTEGGFVRSDTPIPRIAHVPNSVAPSMQVEIPQLFFSMLRADDITGCILSALLSARQPDLAPTIGLIAPDAARRHWKALAELGFSAAQLNYEGTYLDPQAVAPSEKGLASRRPPAQ
jgi:NADPH:quinone reductase-like Zn-dependent oxidoreductase/acyl carrier protein